MIGDILLLCATDGEARPVVERMRVERKATFAGKTTYRGELEGVACRLALTGVGAVNAAHALTREIETEKPRAVVQFGIGGAYVGVGLDVGDVAVASAENYGDLGVITPDGWLSMDEMGFPTLAGGAPRYNTFPLEIELATRAADICGGTVGPFVTVSTCSGVQSVGDALQARFGAICESMEGAAAAHVCAMRETPFLELRGVSNMVEDRDRSRWDIRGAVAAVGDATIRVMGGLFDE